MAQVIVGNIENNAKAVLKQRASQHGWSMEEEVRQILRRAVNEEQQARAKLSSRIAARVAGSGLAESLPELQDQSHSVSMTTLSRRPSSQANAL